MYRNSINILFNAVNTGYKNWVAQRTIKSLNYFTTKFEETDLKNVANIFTTAAI